jgi:hypothetical protein
MAKKRDKDWLLELLDMDEERDLTLEEKKVGLNRLAHNKMLAGSSEGKPVEKTQAEIKTLLNLPDNTVTALNGKQPTLQSGVNIKTFGGVPLTGSGDIPGISPYFRNVALGAPFNSYDIIMKIMGHEGVRYADMNPNNKTTHGMIFSRKYYNDLVPSDGWTKPTGSYDMFYWLDNPSKVAEELNIVLNGGGVVGKDPHSILPDRFGWYSRDFNVCWFIHTASQHHHIFSYTPATNFATTTSHGSDLEAWQAYAGIRLYKNNDGSANTETQAEILGKTYPVKLLSDGKIWMLKNLDYDLEHFSTIRELKQQVDSGSSGGDSSGMFFEELPGEETESDILFEEI